VVPRYNPIAALELPSVPMDHRLPRGGITISLRTGVTTASGCKSGNGGATGVRLATA
jgi:hypothetical protein